MIYKSGDRRGQAKLALQQQISQSKYPFPDKKYDIIALDPPWKYRLRESDQTHRGRTPYPNMESYAIADLPISNLAKENAIIFLWTTKDHLQEAFMCLKVWEFEFKQLVTWGKTTNDRSKIRFGTGHWLRNSCEYFLIGIKGRVPSFSSMGIRSTANIILAPRQEHSRKPEEFYQIVEHISGAKIELFARQSRPGWDCWGAEVDLFDKNHEIWGQT